MKKWIGVVAAVLVIVSGIYLGSPFYAVHSLREAAATGDADKLDEEVDFPAVRESLKSQMSAALMKSMQSDQSMKGNPFAALSAVLMPAIIGHVVDSYVTPEGLAAMIRGHKPTDKTKTEDPKLDVHYAYVGLDRFRVKTRKADTNEEGPSFLFERRGFATWKMIKLELPAHLMDGLPSR